MSGPVLPTVGVVVPLYNSAATIAETLDSALQQAHRALDIVVVDDGSTDHGPELVRERMAAEPRLRLVHQPMPVLPPPATMAQLWRPESSSPSSMPTTCGRPTRSSNSSAP